ncbi:MAG: hypothetical protein HFI35_03435 [Roseburia sp.]|jgi:hypothetical protein|nr:hypothetical protein [Roseburia sp.]
MDTFRETQQEFRFLLLRSEDLRPLWRPEPEIIFLLKGAGHIYFTDSKSEYTLRETDIFVINSFEIQHLELEGNALALSLTLSMDFLMSVSPELLNYPVNRLVT